MKILKIVQDAENSFRKIIDNFKIPLFLISGTFLALLLRYFLLDFESKDYHESLIPWLNFVETNGGFKAFQYNFSNYTPLYLYALVLSTLLPLSKLYAIKLLSILFDFVAAFFVYKIVKEKYHNSVIPHIAFLSVLFAPTIFINSSLWAQCDIIFSSMIIASLFYIIKKRYFLAFIFYGLSLSLKPQGLFMLPLYILLPFLNKEISFKNFLYIPFVYFLTTIPACLAGRSFLDLITLPFQQTSQWPYLSLNAPTVYLWGPDSKLHFDLLRPAGLTFTAFIALIICFSLYEKLKNRELRKEVLMQISLLFSLILPFFLPQMHERYFFLADILSIVYAFYIPKHFFIPIIIILSSFFSYLPFLFGTTFIAISHVAVALLIVIIFIIYDLVKNITQGNE